MKKPRKLKIVFAVTVICILAVLKFWKIDSEDLIGKYHAELSSGSSEELVLLSNGNCHQEIVIYDAKYEASGTWRYDEQAKRLYIKGIRYALTPTGQLSTDLANQSLDSTLGTEASRTIFGQLRIMLSEDIDYKKE